MARGKFIQVGDRCNRLKYVLSNPAESTWLSPTDMESDVHRCQGKKNQEMPASEGFFSKKNRVDNT